MPQGFKNVPLKRVWEVFMVKSLNNGDQVWQNKSSDDNAVKAKGEQTTSFKYRYCNVENICNFDVTSLHALQKLVDRTVFFFLGQKVGVA